MQDDGHGIRVEDMSLLCERHTTSKLRRFEDLRSIGTFGFRGEALASLSYAASAVTVTTMTSGAACAHRGRYRDGRLVESVTPCAGNRGTSVAADNLLQQLEARRAALNAQQEMKHVIHVVQRYALRFAAVAFTLRRGASAAGAEVATQRGSDVDTNVALLFGADCGRELLKLEASSEQLDVKLDGRATSVNYGGKTMVFVLFINDRLVDCSPMKRAIKETYAKLLPKGRAPFVYLNLRMKSENVDVNVHPTKQEVRFRFEDEVLAMVQQCLEEKLKSTEVSRPFRIAAGVSNVSSSAGGTSLIGDAMAPSAPVSAADYEPVWNKVRVDSRDQRLESFLVRADSSQRAKSMSRSNSQSEQEPHHHHHESGSCNHEHDDEPGSMERIRRQLEDEEDLRRNNAMELESVAVGARDSQFIPSTAGAARHIVKRPRTTLTSVLQLLEEVEVRQHAGLSELFRMHVFVGFVDANRVLVQHRTALYMVDVVAVSKALFYQLLLERFESLRKIRLDPPPLVSDLVPLGLNSFSGATVPFEQLPQDRQKVIVDSVLARLSKWREMLNSYWSIELSEDMKLCAIPQVLENHIPDMSGLPKLVMRVATKVSPSEANFFRMLAMELADFYAPKTLSPPVLAEGADARDVEERRQRAWMIENVIFPALKVVGFLPPKEMAADKSVIEITNLDKLYKIFERC